MAKNKLGDSTQRRESNSNQQEDSDILTIGGSMRIKGGERWMPVGGKFVPLRLKVFLNYETSTLARLNCMGIIATAWKNFIFHCKPSNSNHCI